MKQRVLFVDLMRLVAAFQMIQGHTIDAVLADAAREGPIYDAWMFARGLTAVAFAFIAGVSFSLSTPFTGEADAEKRDATLRARAKRGLVLVALGYALRFPFQAFTGEVDDALRAFVAVDVLQLLGVSLLLLTAIARFVPRRAAHVLAAALGLVCFALGPVCDDLAPTGVLAPLLAYVTPALGSLFPLVPYMGFVLCGFAVAARVDGRAMRSALWLCGIGAALYVASLALDPFLRADMRLPHPATCLERLGIVCAFAGLLAASFAKVVRLPRVAEALAGETLVLYAFHVVVVYAAPVGLIATVGHVLSPMAAVLVALVVMLASLGIALVSARFGARAPLAPSRTSS